MHKKQLSSLRPISLFFLAISLTFSGVFLPPLSSGAADNPNSAFLHASLELVNVNVEDSSVDPTSYKGFTLERIPGLNQGSDEITWTSEFYSCTSKTTFRSTDAYDSDAVAGSEVADEAAIDAELSGAGCTALPNSGGFNLSVTSRSNPKPKYSFVEFDATGDQFISLKLTSAAAGETTVYSVSTGFDRPEVASAPSVSLSGSTITASSATFTGDYFGLYNTLYACDSEITASSDKSNVTTTAALTASSCTAVTDEDENIPATIEDAGVITYPSGPEGVFTPLDITGKYLTLVSNVDFTVYEVAEGVLVVSSTPTTSYRPYYGPISRPLAKTPAVACEEVTVKGFRLNTVEEVTTGETVLPIVSKESSSIVLMVPESLEGPIDISLHWVNETRSGKYRVPDALLVSASDNCATDQVEEEDEQEVIANPFLASRLFANYRGDIGAVVESDRLQISEFINSYSGIKRVTCVGRTSGVPAIDTDEALALARATNACGIVEDLVPGATFNLKTATGQGIGQRYRSVIIWVSGRG